jgi:hypothetical protein
MRSIGVGHNGKVLAAAVVVTSLDLLDAKALNSVALIGGAAVGAVRDRT